MSFPRVLASRGKVSRSQGQGRVPGTQACTGLWLHCSHSSLKKHLQVCTELWEWNVELRGQLSYSLDGLLKFFPLLILLLLFVFNWLHYNIGLISVIHQHGWAIGVPPEPPSHLPPFPTPLGCYRAPVWVHWVYSGFLLAIYFICVSIYFCAAVSIHLTLSSLSPTLDQKSVLCVCVAIAALWIGSSWWPVDYWSEKLNCKST